MTPEFGILKGNSMILDDWRQTFCFRRRSRHLNSILLSVLGLVMLYNGIFFDSPMRHCRMIIDHRGTFSHSEILESLLADFPVELPERCQNRLSVDLYLNVALPCRVCSRISEFMRYAETHMRNKTYIGYQSQERTLGTVERRLWYTMDASVIANVYTSAYCRFPFTTEIQGDRTYAVFHESCDAVLDSPHAYWPNPMHPRYFFPNRLPQFPNATTVPLQAPYNFCVIGGTQRRSYHLLEYYYQYAGERHHSVNRFKIVLLGRGKTPPEIVNHPHTQLRINSYVEYQETIATQCHVILGLVDRAEHVDYFNTEDSKHKLSGSIPQASAYKIPMVLHKDLYEIYQDYLPAVVKTHGEDPASFALAMDQMLDHLDQQRQQT